jgi:hypothetical protein
MTVEELVAQAREHRPEEPPPSLAGVDNALRKLLRTLLSGFNYHAAVHSGPGVVCRAIAAILAEVEDLERRH